jgi:hypothetical protein
VVISDEDFGLPVPEKVLRQRNLNSPQTKNKYRLFDFGASIFRSEAELNIRLSKHAGFGKLLPSNDLGLIEDY